MLTPILFASLFAATNAYNLTVRAPDVSYCQDGSEDWITNIVYNINPWPVHIASNEVITSEGSVDLLQTIEEGTKYKLEIVFESPFGDFPIPCVPFGDFLVGSCTWSIEQVISYAAMLGYNCDIFLPEGQPCEFPFRPGSYFKGTYDFTLPELPDIWNPDIFKGNFFWKFFENCKK